MTKNQAKTLLAENDIITIRLLTSRGVVVNNNLVQIHLPIEQFLHESYDEVFEKILKTRNILKEAAATAAKPEEEPENE